MSVDKTRPSAVYQDNKKESWKVSQKSLWLSLPPQTQRPTREALFQGELQVLTLGLLPRAHSGFCSLLSREALHGWSSYGSRFRCSSWHHAKGMADLGVYILLILQECLTWELIAELTAGVIAVSANISKQSLEGQAELCPRDRAAREPWLE